MTKILFVCLGNICRSTMAEFVMRDMVNKRGLGNTIVVASAGTSDEEDGNPVHHGTQRKLRSVGVPMDPTKRARQMTRDDYGKYEGNIQRPCSRGYLCRHRGFEKRAYGYDKVGLRRYYRKVFLLKRLEACKHCKLRISL